MDGHVSISGYACDGERKWVSPGVSKMYVCICLIICRPPGLRCDTSLYCQRRHEVEPLTNTRLYLYFFTTDLCVYSENSWIFICGGAKIGSNSRAVTSYTTDTMLCW